VIIRKKFYTPKFRVLQLPSWAPWSARGGEGRSGRLGAGIGNDKAIGAVAVASIMERKMMMRIVGWLG
jgi:hypothetical protein